MDQVSKSKEATLEKAPERLTDAELESLPVEVSKRIRDVNNYLTNLQQQYDNVQGELRASEERHKQQQTEWQLRERNLLRRLTAKEQEMQDAAVQISELKTSQASSRPSTSTLLDPAVSVVLQKLRTELLQSQQRLDDTQNELSAWKFTPDSNTGKRLMAKCRLLYTENEELGKLTSSGRIAKLESELALQKSFSEEVKKSQSELDEFLQDLDEDVEGMQSTIYYLQQELLKSKETIGSLETELAILRAQHIAPANHVAEAAPRDALATNERNTTPIDTNNQTSNDHGVDQLKMANDHSVMATGVDQIKMVTTNDHELVDNAHVYNNQPVTMTTSPSCNSSYYNNKHATLKSRILAKSSGDLTSDNCSDSADNLNNLSAVSVVNNNLKRTYDESTLSSGDLVTNSSDSKQKRMPINGQC